MDPANTGSGPALMVRPHGCAVTIGLRGRLRFCGKTMTTIKQLIRDEQGGEVIEYALILGLISIAAISIIGTFGTKVLAKWSSVNSSL